MLNKTPQHTEPKAMDSLSEQTNHRPSGLGSQSTPQHKQSYQPWTEEDLRLLGIYWKHKQTPVQMAELLNRSVKAIKDRLVKQGLATYWELRD